VLVNDIIHNTWDAGNQENKHKITHRCSVFGCDSSQCFDNVGWAARRASSL